MIYLLNTPILTEYGKYFFSKIGIAEVKAVLSEEEFTSAVGHQGTADLLSKLLSISVPMNRIAIRMEPADLAIVFRLKTHLPEGRVLSEAELSQLDYEFGILERIE
jgi:hypothetical protein